MPVKRKNAGIKALLCGFIAAFAGSSVPSARGVVWYAPGTGGFNPNLPDFYQHQDFISGLNFNNGANGSNNWEPRGGWCEYTAYSDAMYDLRTRGYTGLFATDPTTNPWLTAMYGPNTTAAGVAQSNIATLVGNMNLPAVQNNWQAYLNLTTNRSPAVTSGALAPLLSNTYPTGANGKVFFLNAFGQLTSSNQNVYTFTNTLVKNVNSEVLYRLNSGSANLAPNANGQSVWWGGNGPGSFHYVALAGINVGNSSVSIADPDTNFGSNTAAGGWPRGQNALNIQFPFSSPAGSPLPVAAAPNVQNFADFSFGGAGRTVSSVAAPQYNGTFVQSVNTIYPLIVRNVRATRVNRPAAVGGGIAPATPPTDEETDLTINLPSDSNPVDQIFVEPSSQTDDPTAEPSEFSLNDDTDASAPTPIPSVWSDTESTADPFGNTIADDGIDYDLTSGQPLEPGDQADIEIGTADEFDNLGYDVFLHFADDPSTVWVPEQIGGTNFDPEDVASEQSVPEPASIALIILGASALGIRRKRRENAM